MHCETSFGKRRRERMPLPASGVKVAHRTTRGTDGWAQVPEQRGPSRNKHNSDRRCSRNVFSVGQGSTGAQRVAWDPVGASCSQASGAPRRRTTARRPQSVDLAGDLGLRHAEHPGDIIDLGERRVDHAVGDVAQVAGALNEVLGLGKGPLGDVQEAGEVRRGPALRVLGDIGGYRHCGASHLRHDPVLLQSELSKQVMEMVTHPRTGLSPTPVETHLPCSCPDRASMGKHVAASLDNVGTRVDDRPDVLS